MKNKDIIFLSRQSLKVHNKTTKKTKFIFIFSLVLAMFSFYILIAYNSMSKQALKNDLFNYVEIDYDNYSVYEKQKEKYFGDSFKEEIDFNIISYQFYYASRPEDFFPKITIDGNEYIYKRTYGENNYSDNIELFFTKGKCFTENEFNFVKNEFNEPLILSGKESVNSKEIIVSSEFLDILNIKYDDAINKNISLKLKHRDRSVKDSLEFKLFDIFSDYKIVGVYNSKLSYSSIKYTTFAYFNYDDYDDMNRELGYSETFFSSHICKDYNSLKKIYDNKGLFYNSYLKESSYTNMSFSLVFEDYMEYYDYFNLIGRLLLFISIIMLIILILNIFISIKFHFFKNKNHFTMCKILGFKNKELLLYYIYYILGYLVSIFIISFFISMIVTIPITYLLNSAIDRSTFTQIVSYSLNIGFFPLAYVIIIGIIIIISIIMSISVYFNNRKNNFNFG